MQSIQIFYLTIDLKMEGGLIPNVLFATKKGQIDMN